jgi:hypothetical protein
MSDNTSNRAVLTFYSNLGGVVQITIPRARINITPAEALAAMNAIISNGQVVTTAGIPLTARSAELVSVNRTPIVPPVQV